MHRRIDYTSVGLFSLILHSNTGEQAYCTIYHRLKASWGKRGTTGRVSCCSSSTPSFPGFSRCHTPQWHLHHVCQGEENCAIPSLQCTYSWQGLVNMAIWALWWGTRVCNLLVRDLQDLLTHPESFRLQAKDLQPTPKSKITTAPAWMSASQLLEKTLYDSSPRKLCFHVCQIRDQGILSSPNVHLLWKHTAVLSGKSVECLTMNISSDNYFQLRKRLVSQTVSLQAEKS